MPKVAIADGTIDNGARRGVVIHGGLIATFGSALRMRRQARRRWLLIVVLAKTLLPLSTHLGVSEHRGSVGLN